MFSSFNCGINKHQNSSSFSCSSSSSSSSAPAFSNNNGNKNTTNLDDENENGSQNRNGFIKSNCSLYSDPKFLENMMNENFNTTSSDDDDDDDNDDDDDYENINNTKLFGIGKNVSTGEPQFYVQGRKALNYFTQLSQKYQEQKERNQKLKTQEDTTLKHLQNRNNALEKELEELRAEKQESKKTMNLFQHHQHKPRIDALKNENSVLQKRLESQQQQHQKELESANFTKISLDQSVHAMSTKAHDTETKNLDLELKNRGLKKKLQGAVKAFRNIGLTYFFDATKFYDDSYFFMMNHAHQRQAQVHNNNNNNNNINIIHERLNNFIFILTRSIHNCRFTLTNFLINSPISSSCFTNKHLHTSTRALGWCCNLVFPWIMFFVAIIIDMLFIEIVLGGGGGDNYSSFLSNTFLLLLLGLLSLCSGYQLLKYSSTIGEAWDKAQELMTDLSEKDSIEHEKDE